MFNQKGKIVFELLLKEKTSLLGVNDNEVQTFININVLHENQTTQRRNNVNLNILGPNPKNDKHARSIRPIKPQARTRRKLFFTKISN